MRDNSSKRSILMRFGRRVKDLRQAQSISQEGLAERAGVHRTYVGMIERGEKNVTILSIQKIAAALGTSISDLFEGYEDGK